MYSYGSKRRRKPVKIFIVVFVLLIGLGVGAFFYGKTLLKPNTQLKQASALTSKITYTKQTQHFDEALFGIDIPAGWERAPKQPGPYNIHAWQTSRNGSDGQLIQIFEDTIPVNYAVNRALIVEGQGTHLELKGEASDNCAEFTKGVSATPNQIGARAKWQGVDFLCDQANTTRDVIGTSSPDGINVVVLRTSTGVPHKYLFSYTNHGVSPDYSLFLNAVQSFQMH